MKRIILIVLIVMNAMVLAGQLWPEQAPPFAKAVNVIFLVLSLIYLLAALIKKN